MHDSKENPTFSKICLYAFRAQIYWHIFHFLNCSPTSNRITSGMFFSRPTDLTIVQKRHCFVVSMTY